MMDKRFIVEKYSVRDMSIDEKYINSSYYIGDKGIAQRLCDLLNTLHEENNSLKLELDTHKHPLWSTREAERKVNELTNLLSNETKKNAILLQEINSLRKENMRLKEVRKYE